MIPPSQSQFDKIELVTRSLPACETWYRIHSSKTHSATKPNRESTHRWNCPPHVKEPDRFGVLYLGQEYEAAFLEVCGRKASTENRYYNPDRDKERELYLLENDSAIAVADLTSHGLARVGQTKGPAGADSYLVTQAWAERIYHHPEQVNGILYRAKANEEMICLALFDRWTGNWSQVDSGGVLGKKYVSEYNRCTDKYRLVEIPK